MQTMSSSHGTRVVGGGLLCELHAHTRWSDGDLELADVVDLYGRAGFDVLCITDHVVRDGGMITAAVHAEYLPRSAGRRNVRGGGMACWCCRDWS